MRITSNKARLPLPKGSEASRQSPRDILHRPGIAMRRVSHFLVGLVLLASSSKPAHGMERQIAEGSSTLGAAKVALAIAVCLLVVLLALRWAHRVGHLIAHWFLGSFFPDVPAPSATAEVADAIPSQVSLLLDRAPKPHWKEPASELDPRALLRKTLDAESWATRQPRLTVELPGRAECKPRSSRSQIHVDALARELCLDGYFKLEEFFEPQTLQPLAETLEGLVLDGWPPVFVFVYAEAWEAFARLGTVLSRLLGTEYKRLPEFWAWYVDGRNIEQGWGPHRDKQKPSVKGDGTANSLTVWIPLTDATPQNGCISLLPARRDPLYGTHPRELRGQRLQDVRVVPARTGSVLAWNHALLHWGGRASPDCVTPRMSLSCEFQRGDVPPFNTPLADPERLPGFRERLRLIGKQLDQYQHFSRASDRVLSLAGELRAFKNSLKI